MIDVYCLLCNVIFHEWLIGQIDVSLEWSTWEEELGLYGSEIKDLIELGSLSNDEE